MKQRWWVSISRVLAASAWMVAAACGHASIFSQDQTGGVLTLHGSEGKAMEDAQAIMASHCGAMGYHLVRRDSVVVGQEAYTSTATDYDEVQDRRKDRHEHDHHGYGSARHEDETRSTSGNVQTNTVSGTREVYETRITYACGQ